MKNIYEYIMLQQSDRQQHLDLSSPCLERGGNSTQFKGLVAHLLDTTIPHGNKVLLCHACHNPRCSNPSHLYWGTPSENRLDAISAGGIRSPYHFNVEKFGLLEANAKNKRSAEAKSKLGRLGGKQPKSPSHRAKIAEALRNRKRD